MDFNFDQPITYSFETKTDIKKFIDESFIKGLQNELKQLECFYKETGRSYVCSHFADVSSKDNDELELILDLSGLYLFNPKNLTKQLWFTADEIHKGNIDFRKYLK